MRNKHLRRNVSKSEVLTFLHKSLFPVVFSISTKGTLPFHLPGAQTLESPNCSHSLIPHTKLPAKMLSHDLKNTSDSPYFSPFPLWALKSQGLPSSECLPSGLPASTFVPPVASSEFRSQGQSFKTNPVPTDSPIPLPTFPGKVFLPLRMWARILPMVRPFLFSLSPKIYLHVPLPQSHLSFHILPPTPRSSSHAGLLAIANVFLADC